MIATAAWIFAGIALWFTRGVLDIFDGTDRTTRVAMLPSAPELLGLVVLSLTTAAGVAALVRRWTSSPDDRSEAFLQISVPLFGLGLAGLPYLPWLPDAIEPLRALAGRLINLVWFVVVGQVVLTALTIRARFRAGHGSERVTASSVAIAVATFAVSAAVAIRLRGTLTAAVLNSAPPVSVGPYQLNVWAMAAIGALAAVLVWRWIVAFTGSKEAATFAWASVFLGAPVLFSSVSSFPDAPAALCIMVALAWKSAPGRTSVAWEEYLVRGLAASALPWLSMTYTPTAVVLVLALGLRAMPNVRAVLALLVPFTAGLIRALQFYQPQALGNPVVGAAGLLFDQEFGVLAYAPALALGFVGLWQMLTARDPMVRQRGRELAAIFGVLFLSASSLSAWWGDAAPPGRPLVSALPLLGFPIAWAYLDAPIGSVRRASYQALALLGIAVSLAMLFGERGALIIQDRDGSSRLLQWFTLLWPAWQAMPAIAAAGLTDQLPLVALWIVSAATVAWLGRKNSLLQPGAAALTATTNLAAAAIVVSLIAPAVGRAEPPSDTDPAARSRLPMLDDFDGAARPHAIIYRPFDIARAADIPPLMTLKATPGLRTGVQPVPVLLNARYALAAGEYQVEIGGVEPSGTARGTIGLQVGRIGSPLHEWEVSLAPGETWRARFVLPIDAEFVGFVASDALATATFLHITPLRIVDWNSRQSVFHAPSPTVLSAVEFPTASMFFHDEEVFVERTGVWVRGESTAYMTIAPATPDGGVTLRVHSGARPNTVTFATLTWGERLELVPGTTRDVHIPPPAKPGPFPLRVTTTDGFVPAEVLPDSVDRRTLGCWMEIAR